MILPKEISRAAALNKVNDRQIEKDYILTWVLWGIAKNPILKENLIFKGGTVLKKVYFEGYRFSEDLDFTLLDQGISNEQLLKEFEKIYRMVKKEVNIDLQFKEQVEHLATGSLQFYINYLGPLGGSMGSRDLKVDITRGEKMEFPPEERKLFCNYSDLPSDSFLLKCYSLSEVFIEKMVALMGRMEPRDLYDFWYLTEVHGLKKEEHSIEYESKAQHKGHDPDLLLEKVLKKENNFKRDWQNKLSNQIHDLPEFEEVIRGSKRNMK